MSAVKLAAIALLATPLGACHDSAYLSYAWDDRRVLCSDSYDDRAKTGRQWALVADELDFARDAQRVALFHAHRPGVTVSITAIERILSYSDANHLEYFTYRDLEPGPPRAGVALAFDDNYPDDWFAIRDLLAAHGARVTFFVSRYAQLTDAQHALLDQLAADGHDIQPHSVSHLHAHRYIKQYGLPALMTDEVQPSLDVLGAAGYTPTTYAYPFGEHTRALDDALFAAGIVKVRTTPGECPN